ncbi:MAG: response regulator [Bacteroidales bacterium]|nr:response regulator [Bacteroidales bacterium]
MAGREILIADDEITGRQLLEAILMAEEYGTILAENGLEVIEICKGTTPDLILLDVMMPDMDGFETLRNLRQNSNTKNIPIILITALDDRDSRIRGLESGATDYITKPFDRVELLAKVKNNLRQSSGQNQPLINTTASVQVSGANAELINEILNETTFAHNLPFAVQASYSGTDPLKAFRIMKLSPGHSDAVCIYGSHEINQDIDKHLSFFSLWILKLAYNNITDVQTAYSFLSQKTEEYAKNLAINPQLWFVILWPKAEKDSGIYGFNQTVLSEKEGDFLWVEFPVSNKIVPANIHSNPNHIYFFSANIFLSLAKEEILHHISTDSPATKPNLDKTLGSIAEKSGVQGAFMIRLL